MDKKNLNNSEVEKLMIRGFLNASIYKGMNDSQLTAFINRDATLTALKFVDKEWQGEVDIKCEYVVIDTSYNKLEVVEANLVFTREYGAKCLKKKIRKLES